MGEKGKRKESEGGVMGEKGKRKESEGGSNGREREGKKRIGIVITTHLVGKSITTVIHILHTIYTIKIF